MAWEFKNKWTNSAVKTEQELSELDAELLNRLIQTVVIGDRNKENGVTEQSIRINYKFVGEIA